MSTWVRCLGWGMWVAASGWAWHVGWLGPVAAGLAGASSLLVWWGAGNNPRRRRSALRYVEMSKQPVGTP